MKMFLFLSFIRILYLCQEKVGGCFNYFVVLIRSILRASKEHVQTMFQADRRHVG